MSFPAASILCEAIDGPYDGLTFNLSDYQEVCYLKMGPTFLLDIVTWASATTPIPSDPLFIPYYFHHMQDTVFCYSHINPNHNDGDRAVKPTPVLPQHA